MENQLSQLTNEAAENITDLNSFQITFSCFSSDSSKLLHVALNSSRKRCPGVLAAALHFVCNKSL